MKEIRCSLCGDVVMLVNDKGIDVLGKVICRKCTEDNLIVEDDDGDID